MKLIITIDTEADNQWSRSDAIEVKNIEYIPRFQKLCTRYHVKPTYLITYEMATSEKFLATVGPYQAEERAEIGAHLHPWTNPPLIPLTSNDYQYHPFPHEYPQNLLQEKLVALTETIEKRFGCRPRTFRAGRYGFDGTVAALLADLGYVADCSVTPYVSWKQTMGNPAGKGGPDFSNVRPRPYFLDVNDCTRAGTSSLLEVPISIFFLQGSVFNAAFRFLKTILKDPQNLLLRTLYKLNIKPIWFRPHPETPVERLIAVYRAAQAASCEYVEMIFHSSELMPGGSKNTKTPEAIEKLYGVFAQLFDFLAHEQVESLTLSEYASEYIRHKQREKPGF